MPKKPNRYGMQEYIPEGHGDESGEYADESGSNVHFTNFKKPDGDENTNPTDTPKETEQPIEEPAPEPIEQPKEEPKQTRIGELSKKQIREIGNYILWNYDPNNEEKTKKLIEKLRYYSGTFGDLNNFSDDDLKDIIAQLDSAERTDERVYFKEGGKWKLTKNKGIMELAGVKTFTKEEMEQAIAQENIKLVEKSQTETDKKIQGIFKNSTVCFGKGYSKDDVEEIYTASQNLVNDFPELSDYVREIGDRNNLEKYINAVNSQKTFSEEEISARMNKIKSMYVFGAPTGERLRKEAIESLQGSIKIDKVQRAYAYWQGSHKRMIFMGKMKDAKESLLNDYNSNFHPTPDVIGVYYHEMGHGVDSMIENLYNSKTKSQVDWMKTSELYSINREYKNKMNNLFEKNYNKEYKKAFEDEFRKKHGISPDDMNAYKFFREKGMHLSDEESNVRKELADKGIKEYNLSRYGITNNAEFIAESFSAHYCKANNQLAEEVFSTVMDYYNKLKEFK